MKQLWIGVGALALVGCVAQKPVMTDQDYRQFSAQWVLVHYCSMQGWMDSDTAARGKRYLQSSLNGVQSTQEDLDRFHLEAQGRIPEITQADCNQMALIVAERKQQIDSHNEMVERDIQQTNQVLNSQQNKQVFCNTVGGVTMCNNGI